MKRHTFCSSALILAAGIVYGQNPANTFTGEIMDSQCSKMGSHAMMQKQHAGLTEKDCTLACVKNGGKFVLFDAAKQIVYTLDDQKKPAAFAGQKVKVTGTVDSATNTIHVQDIAGS
jgi:uncharacterized protein DUF5818